MMLSMLRGGQVSSREMSFNLDQLGPSDAKSRASFAKQDVAHGDTHGNVLRMIKFLQNLDGALEISAEDEKALNVAIVQHNKLIHEEVDKSGKFIRESLKSVGDIAKMKSIVATVAGIIDRIKLHPEKVGRVIWLGDTICDRGPNDYFTALLYQKLHKAKFPFSITMSNHDAVALQAVAEKKSVGVSQNGQFNSHKNCEKLIQKGIVSEEVFSGIIEESYKPHLKLINYTLRGDGSLVLYPHSRVPLGAYKRLAEHFKVKWDCSSVLAFAMMIRKINNAFKDSGYEAKADGVVSNFIWNDPYKARGGSMVSDKMTMPDDVPEEVRAKIYQVHGHIGPHKDECQCVCLDNDLGRYEAYNGTQAQYDALRKSLSKREYKEFDMAKRRYVPLGERSGYIELYNGRMTYTAVYPQSLIVVPSISVLFEAMNLQSSISFVRSQSRAQDNSSTLFGTVNTSRTYVSEAEEPLPDAELVTGAVLVSSSAR